MKLKGKKVLITGASQGFGLALARAFHAEGADLLLGARGLPRLQKAAAGLEGARTRALDVAEEASAAAFVKEASEAWGKIDVLVNNAGIQGPKGLLEDADWKEWSAAVRTNLLGAALMCKLCLPLLRKSGDGRILNISGGGATSPRPRLSAYSASKAGLVRLTETLAEELQGQGVTVNAVAPGAMATALTDELIKAGPDKIGEEEFRKAQDTKAKGGTPPETGAALCVALAGPEGEGVSGRLFSAVWDDWKNLANFKGRLNKSDVYTLRRIVPKDRGMDF